MLERVVLKVSYSMSVGSSLASGSVEARKGCRRGRDCGVNAEGVSAPKTGWFISILCMSRFWRDFFVICGK